MWPTFQQINKEAIQPLDKGEITQSEFFEKAEGPIREFMIKDAKIQIRDVNLFAEISGETYKDTKELSDVPFTTLVPAFILSELRKAFIMGFLIYIPFIVFDMMMRYTDWSARDDIKANLQVDLILLLDEFGYPPVTIDDVYKEVLEQAENFKKYAQ